MKHKYIDFNAIREVPNKYNLTRNNLKSLKILDWERLKQKTWLNEAMAKDDKAPWWCHLEGSNGGGWCDDADEFWIGFSESTNEIAFHFTCYEGMCHYNFNEFYKMSEIDNEWDMNVQVNTMRWLNMMIDEGILGV